jgi:glutathione peroxidase
MNLHRAAHAGISISVRLSALLPAFLFLSKSISAASTIHEFTSNSIDGQPAPLAQFQGNVVLIVNVASRCGFTPQYAGLEALYNKYKDKGFVVLGFPANNFLWQEPGSNEKIKAFCSTKYHVTFPMFAKVSVKGADKTPLYEFLTDKKANPSTGGEIRWNFTKFLADRSGKVIARFGSSTAPESPELIHAIEAALR